MADIVIFVSSMSHSTSGDDIVYHGQAYCSTMSASDKPIAWDSDPVDPGALASAVNTAIKDAAIAAAGDAGYTVGALDKKTLLCGAVGL